MRRESMKGWGRPIAVVALVLGMGLLSAPGAMAGGTTSVLLTSPSSEEAAALTSPAQYSELEGLLGPVRTGYPARPRSLDSAVGTRQINVTWLAHDVSPTRVDRLFPGKDPATLWIHTSDGLPGTLRGYWHRAERPRELAALLRKLGLMGPVLASAGPAIFPPAWEEAGAGAVSAAPADGAATAPGTARASAPGSRLDGWWWAIPGLVAGAVTGLALRRRVRPLFGDSGDERREPGPRRQLLDL